MSIKKEAIAGQHPTSQPDNEVARVSRRRYMLPELLHNVTESTMDQLNSETSRILNGPPVGRELA
jgi:hypothetical protein